MDYFGDSPFIDGWRTAPADLRGRAGMVPAAQPLPLPFQIQKATELAGQLRELDSALLCAYEKCDAEYLASIHARQEREMLTLGLAIRQDQWRDADWQVQALQQTKDVSQTNLLYYCEPVPGGPDQRRDPEPGPDHVRAPDPHRAPIWPRPWARS